MDDNDLEMRIEADPLIGQTLAGCYQIISVLGRGGMGVVYHAKHTEHERSVAVKTLLLNKAADHEVIKRFQLEAKAVSAVRNQHTVNLYDFGVNQDGQPFLVMELLEGTSLRQILNEEKAFSLARFSNIFQQIAEALACAHEAGVNHRDLKPENIMLTKQSGYSDWVYVLDFGIASMVDTAGTDFGGNEKLRLQIAGSPPYMSPEQCTRQACDHRSDIYSLAVLSFEALSGRFPFKAKTAFEIIDCHISKPPFLLKDMGGNCGTYESVSQVLSRALAKNPEKRYQSISEFAGEFSAAVARDNMRAPALKDRLDFEPQGTASKYQVAVCPHCDALTKENVSLCLSCGRSLASINDFSKIRAAKGDFSLPRYQERGNTTNKGFNQKTRAAMVGSGRIGNRVSALVVICLVLLICVFFAAGGLQILKNLFAAH
ncbi:MAG: serine/threonine protein kinase [Candidatus Obscuribacterales bacterium]|nr:serine/threonine protein kinase [Candidatus Obscuribacterales bacterium]